MAPVAFGERDFDQSIDRIPTSNEISVLNDLWNTTLTFILLSYIKN